MTIRWIGSPNFDTNRKPIDKIVLHWIAGRIDSADSVFQDTNRNTSAHYAVGQSEIHQYVKEENVAYHAGSYEINQHSIGIEHEGGPDLPITEAVYKQSIELIAEICTRYNIPIDDYHIIPHRQIKATQCPGTLDLQRIITGVKSAVIPQPIPQPPEITDKTKYDFGEDFGVQELGAIRSILHDLKRDYNGALAQANDLKRQLNECLNKPQPPHHEEDPSFADLFFMIFLKVKEKLRVGR